MRDEQKSINNLEWGYYGKFYPQKVLAIKELRLDTGMSLKDAKDIIDELFDKIEAQVENNVDDAMKQSIKSPYTYEAFEREKNLYNQRNVKRRKPQNMKVENTKTVNRKEENSGSGCCLVSLLLLVFMPLRVIFGLAKKYY